MIEQFYAKAFYNFDKLLEEIRASYPLANLSTGNGLDNTSGIRVQMPDGTNQATMDAIGAIITAHNAAVLTSEQQIESARQAALNQARDYLRKQLLSASPNITTIYNNVKLYVDNNTHLSQMVANNLSLCQNAFVWGILDLVSPTALTRQRYLMVVQITIGILG